MTRTEEEYDMYKYNRKVIPIGKFIRIAYTHIPRHEYCRVDMEMGWRWRWRYI